MEVVAPAAHAARQREADRLLVVEGLSKRFGGVHALRDVDFEISSGEILGLIGPNGSGKSTCVNVLSGTLRPTAGRVMLAGEDVSRQSMDAVVERGMVRTYQATQLFSEVSARENVLIGCHVRHRCSPLSAVFRSRAARAETAAMEEAAEAALRVVGLAGRGDEVAGTLSAADQRLLMIAVAVASAPRLIMLDEPAAGMVAAERRALAAVIRQLRDEGITVLVIEHHMGLIMDVCDRIVVLNFGQKIADGTPAQVRADPAVIEAYLGRPDADGH